MTDDQLDATVLHFALKDKRYMLELSKSVKPEYFGEKFQAFYDIILKHFQDPYIKEVIGEQAFIDHALSNGWGDLAAKAPKIYAALQTPRAADSDFGYFVKKIKDRYNTKVAGDFAKKVSAAVATGMSNKDVNDMFTKAVQEIHSINQMEVFDEGTLGQDITSMRKEYEDVEANPFGFRGVMSGFPSLDNLTNGFQSSELIIISGIEGTGKSLLMMNFGVNAWMGTNRPGMKTFHDNGANVLYFTLEMPRSNRGKPGTGAYLNKRMVSCISELPFADIRMGKLSPEDKKKLMETYEFIEKYDKKKKFYVVDIPRGAKLEDIEVKYLELREQMEIDLIIIDYIGIMAGPDGNDGDQDWKAQGYVAAGLHEFARTYGIPVLTAAQVTRPQGTNNSLNKQNYNTTRVARSAMITQNANIVLQIGCRDEEYKYTDMPIYITKMRDGQTGKLTFAKKFDCMRVYDGQTADPSQALADFESFEIANTDDVEEEEQEF